MESRLFAFDGGSVGPWRVDRIDPVAGAILPDVARLRATAEWRYVEREVDVRLVRDVPAPSSAPA